MKDLHNICRSFPDETRISLKQIIALFFQSVETYKISQGKLLQKSNASYSFPDRTEMQGRVLSLSLAKRDHFSKILFPSFFPGVQVTHNILHGSPSGSQLSLQLCRTLCNPTDCCWPGSSLSMRFSRREYWSGLPFPSPGDLPNPGIESTSLRSPALPGRFFTTSPSGSLQLVKLKWLLWAY